MSDVLQYRNACLRIDVLLEGDGLVLLQILVEVAPEHLVALRVWKDSKQVMYVTVRETKTTPTRSAHTFFPLAESWVLLLDAVVAMDTHTHMHTCTHHTHTEIKYSVVV